MKKIALANPPCKQDFAGRYEKYFIRSGSRWPHYRVKLKNWPPPYLPFPFFLAYSASLLRNKGLDVQVIDGVALDIGYDEFLEKVKKINPQVLFYEFASSTFDKDIELAREIKMHNSSVII
ncbi:MAG: hypothetical protein GF375_05285, partial [Candidatus Omnitrophica bacterium]|nr:hypothetical protein [Candidatus Omnitrophota bacterium]MBD3269402.1 hypothetical protein [Candidatus Omnitrophota bacterium]